MPSSRVLTTCLLAFFVALIFPLSVQAGGEDLDGKELYREFCKGCHLPDSPNEEYTPMTLIQDQWVEFFDELMVPAHENLTDPSHDGKPVLELLTAEELEALREWTIDHAADSEHPMTCG